MNRIKDLSKVKLSPSAIMMEVFQKKKSSIITIEADSDRDKNSFDYGIVMNKGIGVNSIEVGDVIFETGKIMMYSWGGKQYAITQDHSVIISMKPDNFKLEDLTNTILN